MKSINITVYFCGINENLFSDNIMIYKPHDSISRTYCYDKTNTTFIKISDLLLTFKKETGIDNPEFGEWIKDNFNVKNIYVKAKDVLLGFVEDKKIADVFDFLDLDILELVFFVAGGASFHCQGYTFVVHPDEEIHKWTPHVHVRRDDEETRYHLGTLERFPNDNVSRRFLKDEKKRIIPFLKENQNKLLNYWNLYSNGYTTPAVSEDGKLYYKES